MTIKEYIQLDIDPQFNGALPFNTYTQQVPKGYVFTDFQQIPTQVFFIQTGIIQVEIMAKGSIRIIDFFFAPSFFAAYSSLLTKQPSDVRIKAVVDCQVEWLNYSELQSAYEYSLIANKLGRIATQRLYLKRVLKEKQLLTQTAEDNYRALIQQYPEVLQQIPLKEISKYLGITPESLSRIRKRIIS